jgi:1,4-alpha-glucan branching enzyme
MVSISGTISQIIVNISETDYHLIIEGKHHEPHSVLGMHRLDKKKKGGLVVRAFLRDAVSCEVVDLGKETDNRHPMKKLADEGLFECVIPDCDFFQYRLRIQQYNGEIRQFWDPYSFLPSIDEKGVYYFNEGSDRRPYLKLGSRIREIDGVRGVSFAVWAPSAKRVSVVGDFNQWDGRYHPMRVLGSSGIWEIFIPGLVEGCYYKYEIIGKDQQLLLKTDPFASYYEPPPHNSSIVYDIEGYNWSDDAWMSRRSKKDWAKEPVSIYEVHLASWRRIVEDANRSPSYREVAHELVTYVKQNGFTHVQFMPLAEHPFAGSWGYQVTGFYAPTSRFGDPKELMFLIDKLHENNIGIIIDWVPGHFPKDSFALAEFDGSHLYEHSDPRQGQHQDWGTLIFNFGRKEVKSFLIGSAISWMDRFHIDGLRVDAVASMLYLDYSRKDGEWVANRYGGRENIEAIEFLREVNNAVHEDYPGTITIAEESTAFGGVSHPTETGGLGFDFKWNMGWMHDTLRYFQKDPLFRKWNHNDLTFGMIYNYSEKFVMVYSHDEVVHGKGSLMNKMAAPTISEKARNLRALYAFMWAWPGKKTLFMGCEFGQMNEWQYDSSLDWHLLQYKDHEGITLLIRDLNHWYTSNPSLAKRDHDPQGFSWINCFDSDNSTVSFLRFGEKPGQTFAVVINATPVSRSHYRLGLPFEGVWKEVHNTDASVYGGYDGGNMGQITAINREWDNQKFSADVFLPGLTTLIFQFAPEVAETKPAKSTKAKPADTKKTKPRSVSSKLVKIKEKPNKK